MTNETVSKPLPESSWQAVRAALLDMQREEHAAVAKLLTSLDALHEQLRQTLQGIALEDDMPANDGNDDGG